MSRETTIQDLIDMLAELLEECGSPDTPVRMAVQPRHPFAHRVAGMAMDHGEDGHVLYLGQGAQIDHLPGTARAALRDSGTTGW
ncbi:hypothetical protein CLV63_11239 [Murinocardiopsis flavida]|uniref:Uncharacterized protein n=1 Tax=Murinocardiopsis flavida TaxID=645275 RepID=A0A2P8DG13_9ACTN|nr:hypothetical protein [Murinocardiopsis flavida]PSK96157.1 hypothetical protein CLV63_11239 [Murinocardiopsis flavida]